METEYLVQVAKGNGAYKTRYRSGNLAQVSLWYKGLNVGNGWRKRLLMMGALHRTVLARQVK